MSRNHLPECIFDPKDVHGDPCICDRLELAQARERARIRDGIADLEIRGPEGEIDPPTEWPDVVIIRADVLALIDADA